ncbi:MAG: hypothetical protein ACI31R_03140 [Bacilli bacterium]
MIYDDKSININNIKDLINQFEKIADSRLYKINLNNPKYNWLDKNIDEVIDKIKDYLVNMETVTI